MSRINTEQDLNSNDVITITEIMIKKLNENNDLMNEIFIKSFMILKQFPPRLNENKFLYGILIQKVLINIFNIIFNKCIDLDKSSIEGCEYKNDCRIVIVKYLHLNCSIKVKKNNKGNITLINKNNSENHNLGSLITIILVIEEKQIYIIPNNIIPKKYIKNIGSKIEYKSSIFKYMNDEHNTLIYNLKENDKFRKFMRNDYDNIEPKNIYDRLYDELCDDFKKI
jgi:hypothetical protein